LITKELCLPARLFFVVEEDHLRAVCLFFPPPALHLGAGRRVRGVGYFSNDLEMLIILLLGLVPAANNAFQTNDGLKNDLDC